MKNEYELEKSAFFCEYAAKMVVISALYVYLSAFLNLGWSGRKARWEHDFAMANFGHLFLKSPACSLAHIKLVLSEALFSLQLCSQAEELARHLLQNPNK